jgi:aspartyl-tRNA(Asn)/glutamyl-tRNA(Gln) amidotransferase subunit A
MDHAGPLAPTAEDCALLLGSVAGYDASDPACADTAAPDLGGLYRAAGGLRFAAPRGYFEENVAPVVRKAVDEAAEVFGDMGAVRVDRDMPFAEEMFQMNRVVLPVEAATWHAANLASRRGEFGADVLKRLEIGERTSAADYARAKRRQVELTRELALYFRDVDFVLMPTTRVPAPTADQDAVTMAQHLTAFTAPFNLTGFPAVSLPCGFTEDGLPIGLQVVGRRWEEGLVLQVAHQYQLATDWHLRVPLLAA